MLCMTMQVADGDIVHSWAAEIEEYPAAVAISPGGEWIAAGDASGRIAVLDAASGVLRERWQAHDRSVQTLAWHPTLPVLLSGGQDGCARLWGGDGTHRECTEITRVPPWVDHVSFNSQGTRLAVAAGKHLAIAGSDGTHRVSTREHASSITGMVWRPDGEQVVTACYGGIQTVLADSAQIKRRFKWTGSMVSLTLSPNGKIAAGGCQDNSVHFWRLNAGTDAMMSGYPAKPTLLSWRADSQLLAVAGGAEITLWSFANKGPEGTRPVSLQHHREMITALAFAPRGGGLVSGCRDGQVVFWLPGRSNQPLFKHTGMAEIVRLLWGAYDDRMRLVIADAAGKVQCLEF